MIKLWTIIGGLAVIGAAIGYAGVLCPGGACAITGSWWGGAAIGGVLGLAVHDGCCCR